MVKHNSADEFPEDERSFMHVGDIQDREDAAQLPGDLMGKLLDEVAEQTRQSLKATLVTEEQRLQGMKDRQDSGDTSIAGRDIWAQTDEVNRLRAEVAKYNDTLS